MLNKIDELNKKGDTKSSFAQMEKLRLVSMFTINMGGVCPSKIPVIKQTRRVRQKEVGDQ